MKDDYAAINIMVWTHFLNVLFVIFVYTNKTLQGC